MLDTVSDEALRVRGVATSPPVLLVAGGVLLLETIGQWALAPLTGTGVSLAGVAVVVAVLVLGTSARWAVAMGLFVAGALVGNLLAGAVPAIAGFLAATVGSRTWAGEALWRLPEPWAWYARYATLAVGSVLVYAGTSAWLVEVADRAAFSVTVGPLVASTLPATLLAAPVIRAGMDRFDGYRRYDADRSLSARARAGLLVIALAWIVSGFPASFLFRGIEQAPATTLAAQLPGVLTSVLTVWGHQGRYAMLLLGAGAVTAIVAILHRDRLPERAGLARLRRWIENRS